MRLSHEYERIARIVAIVAYVKFHPVVSCLVDISLNVAVAIAIEIHIDNVVLDVPVARFVEAIGAYDLKGSVTIELEAVVGVIRTIAYAEIDIANIPPTRNIDIVIFHPEFFTRRKEACSQQQQKGVR